MQAFTGGVPQERGEQEPEDSVLKVLALLAHFVGKAHGLGLLGVQGHRRAQQLERPPPAHKLCLFCFGLVCFCESLCVCV